MSATIETIAKTFGRGEKLVHWQGGEVIFREGEAPQGVYVLHSGVVDLLFHARNGTDRPLRLAEAGQILGLSYVVSDQPYDCSATTRTQCVTGFIDKDDFLQMLHENPAIWFSVLELLSSDINSCYESIRTRKARPISHEA